MATIRIILAMGTVANLADTAMEGITAMAGTVGTGRLIVTGIPITDSGDREEGVM
jgi:hypothetical protein